MAGRWFTEDITRELGIPASTWRGYVCRGQAPAPRDRVIVGSHARPWWDSTEVRAWAAARPGRGNRSVRRGR